MPGAVPCSRLPQSWQRTTWRLARGPLAGKRQSPILQKGQRLRLGLEAQNRAGATQRCQRPARHRGEEIHLGVGADRDARAVGAHRRAGDPAAGREIGSDREPLNEGRSSFALRPRRPGQPIQPDRSAPSLGDKVEGRVDWGHVDRFDVVSAVGIVKPQGCRGCRDAQCIRRTDGRVRFGHRVHRDRRTTFQVISRVRQVHARAGPRGTWPQRHVLPILVLRAGDEDAATVGAGQVGRVQVGAVPRVVVRPQDPGMGAAHGDPGALDEPRAGEGVGLEQGDGDEH